MSYVDDPKEIFILKMNKKGSKTKNRKMNLEHQSLYKIIFIINLIDLEVNWYIKTFLR